MEGTTPETQNNRNKHICCSVYGKNMRYDIVKRRAKTHKDSLALNEE